MSSAPTSPNQHVPSAAQGLRERPGAALPRPYVFPEVREILFREGPGAGGRILAAHLPGQPMAWLSLMLGGGALREPAGLDGLARATAGLLDEGTAKRSADEFGTAVESLGGIWAVDTGWETVRLSIDVPAAEAQAGADLLAEAARTPAFTDADCERYLSDLAASKRESFARPGPRAQAALRGALFDPETRFGRLAGGDPDTNAALTGAAVRAHHASWLRGPGILLVAGDLDRIDLDALGRTVFADGIAQEASEEARPAVVAAPARLVIVDRPGAVQSTVRVGHAAPTRSDAAAQGIDVVALRVGSTILGGSFSSRINHELREVKGYTYGAQAGFDLSRPAGMYSCSAEVRTDATADAVADLLRVIAEFIDGGATAEELEKNRAYLAGATPIGLQTPASVGYRLYEIARHELPYDYVTAEHARLLELGLDDVDTAVRAALHPAELVVAVEGDESVIGPALAALGL